MDSLKLAAPSISPAPLKLFVLFTSKDGIRGAQRAFVFGALALLRVSGCVVAGTKRHASGPALCF